MLVASGSLTACGHSARDVSKSDDDNDDDDDDPKDRPKPSDRERDASAETDAGSPAPDVRTLRWPSFGGGPTHANASSSRDLSSDSIASLGLSWYVDAPGVTATPVVYEGIVYWADWMGGVYASRIADGSAVWETRFARGFTSTPSVTEDRVYLSDRDALVRALDRETGDEIWTTPIDDNPMAQLWSSPMLAGDTLIVGIGGKGTQQRGAPIDPAILMMFRGAVVGLDARNGEILWRVETTRVGDEEFGAGAAVWSSAAIDEEAGLAFIGTGNSYYSPASPLSDSLLAIEYETGELRWSRQFTANDNYTSGMPIGPDSDVGAAPNLFRIGDMDVVGVGDKSGSYYAMERSTGELLWMAELTQGSSVGGVISSAAHADGTLYVSSNQNFSETHIFALRADDGAMLWTREYPGVTYGNNALAGDLLFTTTTSVSATGSMPPRLFALRIDNGEEVWSGGLPVEAGGGSSVVGPYLLTGYGFHFFNDARDPLVVGGLAAFRVGGSMGGADAGVMEPEAPTGDPTFDAVYREVLEPSGCTTTMCHGAGGMLSLQDRDTAHGNLVDAEAEGELCASTGLARVAPGDPDESLLYLKLLPDPPCGVRMPVAGALEPAQIEQIREWISRGANDD
jgi:polyvinyl alcohol dehydrogenase (cytochrome)